LPLKATTSKSTRSITYTFAHLKHETPSKTIYTRPTVLNCTVLTHHIRASICMPAVWLTQVARNNFYSSCTKLYNTLQLEFFTDFCGQTKTENKNPNKITQTIVT